MSKQTGAMVLPRKFASKNGHRLIEPIEVERLLLDGENPRLASGRGGDTQFELLKVLWEEMAVDEVALSIAANGFFQEEPLFVIPRDERDAPKRKYIVVEGNRRLAAVMLLLDENLRRKVGATDLPGISPQSRERLRTLPVSIYDSREQLWEYFGFRHINGPKPWDAFSKAQYVANVRDHYGVSLDEIARKIGDRHSTVVRLYRGYKLLSIAEAMRIFRKEDAVRNRFYFSHLYTAADQPDFQEFLGITPERFDKPNKHRLEELMLWLYGSKRENRQPVVRTQNPDLNLLRIVVSSKDALAALRSGYSLERAHDISIGDAQRFREALTRAKEDLQQAKATVTFGYGGESDLMEAAENISVLASSLKDEMETLAARRVSKKD